MKRLTVALGITTAVVASLVITVPPAFADGGSAGVSVVSVSRNASNGVFEYDINAAASGFVPTDGGTDGECQGNGGGGCSLGLEAEVGPSDVVTPLDGIAVTPDASNIASHEFVNSANLEQVTAVRTVMSGYYGSIHSDWEPVIDPYPADATTINAATIGRDTPTGNLTFDITADAGGFWMPGAICQANGGGGCTLGVQAELTSDSSTIDLASDPDNIAGQDYPFTKEFTGPSASLSKITAVRSYVDGFNGEIYSGWFPVTDPYAAPSTSIVSASTGRDPDNANFTFDVTTSASGYWSPGSVCQANGGGGCSMNIQAEGVDGSTTDLGSYPDNIAGATYPSVHEIQGSADVEQVTAIRSEVVGANGQTLYSGWQPIFDPYNAPSTSVTVNSISRDADTGNLDYSISATGYGYTKSSGVCLGNGGGGCSIGLQAEVGADNTITPLGDGDGGIAAEGYTTVHTFTTPADIGTVTAVRSYVQGYLGTLYSPWTPVSENVDSGHDLGTIADEILRYIGLPDQASDATGSSYRSSGLTVSQGLFMRQPVAVEPAFATAPLDPSEAAEVCLEAFPFGPDTNETSLNDEDYACTAAVEADDLTIRTIIIDVLQVAGPAYVSSLIDAFGFKALADASASNPEYPSSTNSKDCSTTPLYDVDLCPDGSGNNTVPTRTSDAPPEEDPTYTQNQENKLQQYEPNTMTDPQKQKAREDLLTCDEYVSTWDTIRQQTWGTTIGVTTDDCDKPIFFTGSSTPQASQHDLDAILGAGTDASQNQIGAQPFLLHYAKRAEKPYQSIKDSVRTSCVSGASEGYQCDEYPFWSSDEGRTDTGAVTGPSPSYQAIAGSTDNGSQGTYLRNFYQGCPILQSSTRGTSGREYLVVPVLPLPTFNYCPGV
jgi:hypothetical protein